MRPLRHPRELRVLHNDWSTERSPGMLIEVAADHLAILRPLSKRDRRAVNADESLSVIVDERQEVGFLLVVHLERAASKEEHGIEVSQVLGIVFELFLCQWLSIGADGCVPKMRLATQTLDSRQCVRDSFMPVALLLADREQLFSRRRRCLSQQQT